MGKEQELKKVHGPLAMLAPLLLLGLTTLVYANTFGVPFLFDDAGNITKVAAFRFATISWPNLWHAATHGFLQHRPLANLSFAFNVHWGGSDVWGFHLVNLLVHLATALVLYRLLVATLKLPSLRTRYNGCAGELAMVAALIWAIHPIQTNAVTYIVQRMTTMAALFTLAALYCYLRGRLAEVAWHCWGWFAVALLAGGLALLSKENGAILPVLVASYEIFFLADSGQGIAWRRLLPWLGVAVLLLGLLAVLYLGEDFLVTIQHGYLGRDFTMGERLLTQSRVIFLYLSLLLLPLPGRLNLCHDIAISHHLLAPPQTAVAILGLLVFVAAAGYLFRRDPLASFAIVWFFAGLLIESTIIPLEMVFEHRLYLPSTFIFLPVVVLLYRLFSSRPWAARLLWGTVIVFLAVCTWQRNETWGSSFSLWSDVVHKSPQLARGYANLGRAVETQGEHVEAARLFRKAILLNPGDGKSYDNLGVVYARQGRYEEAEQIFTRALAINPGDRVAISNLGNLYAKQDRCQAGGEFFTAMLSRPGVDQAAVFAELANVSRCLGNLPLAITQARRSLGLDENQVATRITLAIALYETGHFDEAMGEFRKAWVGGYDVVGLLLNVARAKFAAGGKEEARQIVRQVLALEPQNREGLLLSAAFRQASGS